MSRISVIDENKIREKLNNCSIEEVMEYAYKYLVHAECGRQRKSRMMERNKNRDEKNKC